MISITELNQQLSSRYTIKCFVDLASSSSLPGQAYKQFQLCYQEEFNNNDRLVFYTSEEISDKLLTHLYQAANLIDISNFFVLICSPHNIKDRVESIANLCSADKSSFQTLQVNLEKTAKLQDAFTVPESLCPMPWMHLEVSTNGGIRPCCVYSRDVDNVNNSSLNNTFYGPELSALREEFLSGVKPSGCNHCWNLESKGLTSNRTYHINLLKAELLTSKLENPVISSLDLKPSNTCNFKCRICSPSSSSLFAQEAGTSVKTFRWAEDNSEIMNEIIDLIPNLTNIDLYGGEPFLIKPLQKLVSTAVKLGHSKNIRLHYNSNGSVYPTNLIEYWKQFKHIDIQFSIDNVGSRFELERGGNWQLIETNIRNLINLNLPNVKISVMPAINIMNVFYLDELMQFANNLNIPVNPLYVTSPKGFDIKNLTVAAKQLITEKFKHYHWTEMQNILKHINSYPDSDGQEFIKICRHFDSIRNQDFSKSHPEIAAAMGYTTN